MTPTKWGELTDDGVRHYPLSWAQAAVLNSCSRITLGSAGTGGGKTVVAVLWLLKQIARFGGLGRYLVVSPTYKIFKQSRLLDAFLEAVQGTQLQGQFNKTQSIYTLATGGEVFFRSAENPDSLEGGQYHSLLIDEAAKLSYDAWVKAAARVGARQGDALLVSTPDVNNWLFDEVFRLATDGPAQVRPGGCVRTSLDGSVTVVQWTSTVNPTYSAAEVERQRKLLPDAVFRRRYLGEFASLDGLVYPTFASAVLPEPTPAVLPSPAVRVVGGIDWGWSDPAAVLVGAECQDGVLYLVEEIYESRLPLDVLAQRLKRLVAKWNVSTFYCDHSRPEILNQLRRHGVPVQARRMVSTETGIAMADARLRSGYLRVYGDCKNLVEEAKTYQRRPRKDGDYSEKPVDANNHACDAARYLVVGLDFGRNLNFTTPDEQPQPQQPPPDPVDAAVRLGRTSPDPTVRQQQDEAARQAARERRMAELMNEDD